MGDGGGCCCLDGVLTSEELAIVSKHPEDAEIIARIKLMSEAEIDSFRGYRAKNLKHSNMLRLQWMDESGYLLGTRLNRCPTESEWLSDYIATNSARFRVFYALKFPECVERVDDIEDIDSNRGRAA